MSRGFLRRSYWVYIMTNKPNGTLYVGVTNSIERRVWEHRSGGVPGFTKRYRLTKLVHFEEHSDVNDAIAREKQLKGWLRAKKVALIEEANPRWDDLAKDWFGN
jgi:putative endonuclease